MCDVVAEEDVVFERRVVGEAEKTHADVVGREIRVDTRLEVDGLDLALVHETRLLDLVELLEDAGARLVSRKGDVGYLERGATEDLGGPGEELVVFHAWSLGVF